ncbi:MAG: SDR family oxidoreductase, partial [Rhodospirillales bacterium]
RGIGRAIAAAFAEAGAEVTVTGTRAGAGDYDGDLSGLSYRQARMEDAASVDARPGCIVNIASMYSYFASPHAPGYGAGKAAIPQLTKSLAALYAPDGIRVNAIAPGWTETELTAPIQADAERDRVIRARTPMGRWGTPGEIAAAALYLASDDVAGFVTGATIPVDGGYSAA